jgi:hypothetical protein
MKDPRNEREARMAQDEGFASIGKQTPVDWTSPHRKHVEWESNPYILRAIAVVVVIVLALAMVFGGGIQ